jgi:hypothetical protein
LGMESSLRSVRLRGFARRTGGIEIASAEAS